MKQNNEPKCSSKSKTAHLRNKIIQMLRWTSQSLDMNLTEMLTSDVKRAEQMFANLNKMKQFCK